MTQLLLSLDRNDNQYRQAHLLHERGGKALTELQASLDQAHVHALLARDYMSAKFATDDLHLSYRYELAAKAHNSAAKKWQAFYEREGDEASAVQATVRAAESGRKAVDEAHVIDRLH